MDNWPGALQQKLNADNFEVKYGSTVVRSDMDVGPAKTRSRFTDAVDIYTTSIDLEFDEYTTFKSFYRTTLANGTLPFLFTDPLTNTSETFRFVDPPSVRPIGNSGLVFKVQMTWEKLP